MRNNRGLTVFERIAKDIEFAETVNNNEQRRYLANMAISSAELAIDFKLISLEQWEELLRKAFKLT